MADGVAHNEICPLGMFAITAFPRGVKRLGTTTMKRTMKSQPTQMARAGEVRLRRKFGCSGDKINRSTREHDWHLVHAIHHFYFSVGAFPSEVKESRSLRISLVSQGDHGGNFQLSIIKF